MLTSSKTMVLLMTLRRASTLAPKPTLAWKPKATLSGRLEGLEFLLSDLIGPILLLLPPTPRQLLVVE